MNQGGRTRILILVNPKSGLGVSFRSLRAALERTWETPGTHLWFQFSRSAADGAEKARQAVRDGVETILVAGGDGTVNSVGRELIDTKTSLGVIPAGSGNGFARHFGIPLSAPAAVCALAQGERRRIDVGMVNDIPFFVTCSMAWDASIARAFQKSPVRGFLPYIFAGVQEFMEYVPQPVRVELDGGRTMTFPDPLIFTVANLTQYGGGAKIAPHAKADDGQLELVVAPRQNALKLIANLGRLFNGTVARVPELVFRRFRELVAIRPQAAPIQVDGEPVETGSRVTVRVRPAALRVIVPCRAAV